MAAMKFPVCAVLAVLLVVSAVPPLAADDDAPQELTWHHEGFAAISKAANEAKAHGKRLLLGLSGGPT